MVNTDPSKLEKETEKPSEVLMSNGIGLEAFHIPSAGIAPQAPVTKKHVMMSGPQQARFVLPITLQQEQQQLKLTHNLEQANNLLLIQQQSYNNKNNNSSSNNTLPVLTHSLIPLQLQQAIALPPSLHGSPENQPTLKDRHSMVPPLYNGVNPNYPGLRMIHANPPVFCVDNFLNNYECDFLIHAAHDAFGPAPVVGKGVGEVSPSRTSSTCYLAREDLPDYMRKISALTGKPVEHCELPQVGRYFPSEQYLQVSHLFPFFLQFDSC